MKVTEILYCAFCCTQLIISCLYFSVVPSVALMPTVKMQDFNIDVSGSGSGFENLTLMTNCKCNDTSLTVDRRKFLLKWRDSTKKHSIGKLSIAANDLKVETEYFQVVYICTSSL